MIWLPTRVAGLARLEQFLPHAGSAYAATRNFDYGPADRSNISALSPWLRRRILTEEVVIAAAIRQHGSTAAAKFIEEIVWRSYWKGWLEMRSAVYVQFEQQLQVLQQDMAHNAGLRERYHRAASGQSGIDCFDAWTTELIEHGWLHNHARMWFASIWIFTLGLPWQLGAEFFYQHLLDADPASNTLSWRWVAGLHTAGKHYLARAENIQHYSAGRFNPVGQLDEQAPALIEDRPPPPAGPPPAGQTSHSDRIGLLLNEEDLNPESWPLNAQVAAVALLPTLHPGTADQPAKQFATGAITDAAMRASSYFNCTSTILDADSIGQWAGDHGLTELVTGYAPLGPVAKQLDALEHSLAGQKIRLVRLQRAWDSAAWPQASAGYFKMKQKIPQLIAHLQA
jgi:deoxyribodipyrimidine photo-lyase